MIGIFSQGILKIPYIEQFIGAPVCRISTLHRPSIDTLEAIAVWGYRPSAVKPARYAQKKQLPLIRLEDGFIRSVGLGVNGEVPLSIVIDHYSIYYDALQPSELEILIKNVSDNAPLYKLAEQAIEFICEHHLSKYNHCADFIPKNISGAPKVLVIDQTMNDMGILYGNANEKSFNTMLKAALAEYPNHDIWVKTHPDVLIEKKYGYFSNNIISNPRIKLITDNVSPLSLLKHVNIVYTVTSQMGFEALLLHKKVITFGQPWYAGWGLTDDRHSQASILSARRGTSSLINMFTAAYLRYCRYINPATGKQGSIFDVMQHIAQERRHRQILLGKLSAPSLSLWKKTILRPYLKTPINTLTFLAPESDTTACVVWGVKGETKWKHVCEIQNIPIWIMEDGFLRSVGLGSDLTPPLSLVLDKTGIYYDATRPSELENILNTIDLTPAEIIRAKKLHKTLVKYKLSKYNVGNPFALNNDKKKNIVILVPGQVEDDASIQMGSPIVKTNLDLLMAVRKKNPDAFIIFKPHPDVLAGNRAGTINYDKVNQLSDAVIIDADIIDCIHAVDEVHTMTSLAGFEALLHGKKVTCYGLPFYAGWGLTADMISTPRRIRKLSFAELLFATYIRYPTYINPDTAALLSVEEAIQWLKNQSERQTLILSGKLGWLQRQMRKLYFLFKTLLRS